MTNQSGFESGFLYNPDNVGMHCHSATVTLLSDGTPAVVWYAYPEEETKNANLIFCLGKAGTCQWDKPKVISPPGANAKANPVIFERPDGGLCVLYVSIEKGWWSDSSLYMIASKDRGQTWAPPEPQWPTKGMMVRHTPFATESQALLLPAYDESIHRSLLLESQPPYGGWKVKKAFEEHELIQPVLIREPGDGMCLFFRPCKDTSRHVWRSFSSDRGVNWSVPIATTIPNPLSGIAAFRTDSGTSMVYNPDPEKRFPLVLGVTKNSGVSWSQPIVVDDANFEVSYPSFTSDKKGNVYGVYTYNRRMIKYVRFTDEWIAERIRHG